MSRTSFQSAFITGASSGFGRALARAIAAQGTRVVVAARREIELVALQKEIVESGGCADVCMLDVTEPDAVYEAIQTWDKNTGGLDLVIANAGLIGIRCADELAWGDIAPILNVNITGALATLAAGINVMRDRKRGTLVGISSLAGARGLPRRAAYGASKAALSTFLESIRTDLSPRGIVVVEVRPGFIDTPMTKPSKFKMPFLLSTEEATKIALAGIQRGKPIVAFPWQLSAAVSACESMPDSWWRAIARRLKM